MLLKLNNQSINKYLSLAQGYHKSQVLALSKLVFINSIVYL